MTVESCARILSSYLPEPHASLISGILFGLPLKTSPIFYNELKRVGLLHLVVLSGSNITIVGNTVGALTGFLPKKASLFAGIISIVAFTVYVGPKPPIVRAAIMGSLALAATVYGKRNSALISLLIAVVGIAVLKSEWISTLSFQLSAAATLGIILFGGNTKGVAGELRTSLAAQVFTAPLIFFSFREISVISPVSTLLVSFLIAPLMIIGTLTTVAGYIHYSLGLIPGYILFALLQYMLTVIHILSRLPFSFFSFKQ